MDSKQKKSIMVIDKKGNAREILKDVNKSNISTLIDRTDKKKNTSEKNDMSRCGIYEPGKDDMKGRQEECARKSDSTVKSDSTEKSGSTVKSGSTEKSDSTVKSGSTEKSGSGKQEECAIQDECATNADGSTKEQPAVKQDCSVDDIHTKEDTGNTKEDTGNTKEDTGNTKEDTGNTKEDTGNTKENAGNTKEDTGNTKSDRITSFSNAEIAAGVATGTSAGAGIILGKSRKEEEKNVTFNENKNKDYLVQKDTNKSITTTDDKLNDGKTKVILEETSLGNGNDIGNTQNASTQNDMRNTQNASTQNDMRNTQNASTHNSNDVDTNAIDNANSDTHNASNDIETNAIDTCAPQKIPSDDLPIDSEILQERSKENILGEGHFWKKRRIFACFWHEKYFVLTKQGLLKYHKANGTKYSKGNWDMKEVKRIHEVFAGTENHPYRLVVIFEDDNYLFAYDDANTREYWLKLFSSFQRH